MTFFITTYSNKVKKYCDTEFFANLSKLSMGNPVMIVINDDKDEVYTERVRTLTHAYPNFSVHHITVPREPYTSQFQRNVTESVNLCRDEFLRSKADNMVIIESDVLPPLNLLDKFEENALYLTGEKWGIVGGLYYKGFHDYSLEGLQPTHHVLSGCTMYNRDFIKTCPFRYDEGSLGAFPDAWSSVDATLKGYTLWNDHLILCEHLNNPETGTRYSGHL